MSPRSARPNFPTAHHRHVGRQLWQRAGVKPADIPVAQFYENFTGPVLMAIAEMGFCEPGELNDFVADGNLQWPNGRLPDQHERRQPRRGLHPRLRQRRRGRAPGPGRVDCQVSGVELSLSVSGPGYAPGSAVLFGKA